ncbi:ribosomal protein S18-alanine N-acetyltransferase [Moraxella nasovis]|uniref:ribosomal protein S18-alanine N-acetyltransferase n=1 Tax=Moraxella nasovis TaxID=2904121 RepID=UPI001F60C9D1|nr:ribosomal protein S18-alanine N-acetyltransferase [Moraxella nasovis]UNU73787.1 ribosomal protein S18-alanine N-acetyltransferase [Moraxella nasovis]
MFYQKGVVGDVILDNIASLELCLQADDAWDRYAIQDVLNQYGSGALWQMSDDVLVGYCLFSCVFEMAEILRIGTHPRYQKQGIARGLIKKLCQLCTKDFVPCERILLEVRADNMPAIYLYQTCGFVQIDVRKNYYKTSSGAIDAIIFQKQLLI